MKKIIHYLVIKAPRAKAFRALTTAEGLAGWWSTRVEAGAGIGGVVRFRFMEGFDPEMEITEIEPDRAVGWRCVGGHERWRENTFRFELSDAEGGTGLLFVQRYARELADEVYGNYNFNWGYYLSSLKQLCETGEGAPFEPDTLDRE